MPNHIASGLFRFVIAVCFLTILTSGQAHATKPVAVVKADAHDFGSAYEGPDITHDFVIQNTGDAPLIIRNVNTG